MARKIRKVKVEKVIENILVVKESGSFANYNVELLREGPLSGEYRFKTKGSSELGWQVSAGSLKEAFDKAEAMPAGLRS